MKIKRLRIIIPAVSVLMLLTGCSNRSENGYFIKGRIEGKSEWLKDGTLVLMNRNRNSPLRDTVKICNGKFEFRGTIDIPDIVAIFPLEKDAPRGRIMFFMENDRYKVTCIDTLLGMSDIRGGETNTLFREFGEFVSGLNEMYDIYNVQKQLDTKLTPDYRRSVLEGIKGEYTAVRARYRDSLMLTHTPSYFSLEMTIQGINSISDMDSLMSVMEIYKTTPEFRNDPRVERIFQYAQKKRDVRTFRPDSLILE